MPSPEVIKERMRQQGYLPDPFERQEHRIRRGVEYSALYLGEIDKKLDKIIELLQSRQDT